MLTLYHCPGTRSGSAVWLLEELAVPYELEIVPVGVRGDPPESYRAIHPHKKVPAIVHDGVAVTERAAIFAYLCDAFPAAGLAPPIGSPRRGPYLSWLVYNDAVIDPVLAAKFMGWDYDKRGVSFGAFEDMVSKVETTLTATPYLTGAPAGSTSRSGCRRRSPRHRRSPAFSTAPPDARRRGERSRKHAHDPHHQPEPGPKGQGACGGDNRRGAEPREVRAR